MTAEASTGAGSVARASEYAEVTLSALAATRLTDLMAQKDRPASGVRLFVHGGGCCGLQYGLAFVDGPGEEDLVFESEGVRVVVDPVSMPYVQGVHIDYVETAAGAAFRIDNPNTTGCAGCGQAGEDGGCASAAGSDGGGEPGD